MPVPKTIVSRSIRCLLPTLAALLLTKNASSADTYIWDAIPLSDGAQDGTGAALWQAGIGNWFNQTSSLQDQSWLDGSDAVFGANAGSTAGTINLGSAIVANSLTFNTAPSSSTYSIAGSATNTLTVSTGNITTNASAAIGASLVGATGLTKAGAGTLTLNGGDSNTFTGTTTVNAGGLTLSKTGGATAIAGDIQVNTGGTVTLGGSNQIADTASITVSGGTFSFASQSETFQNFTQTSGGGTLLTGGTINILGTMSISGGGSNNSAVGYTVNSGGSTTAQSVVFTSAQNSGAILIGGASTSAVTTFTVGSGGLNISGQTITLNVAAAGQMGSRLVLNGDVTATGSTHFQLNNTSATSLVAGSVAELSLGSSTRTFAIDIGTTTTVAVPIAGSGGLTKTGAGVLTMSGGLSNTYTGLTTISAGSISLDKNAGSTAIAGDILVAGGALNWAEFNEQIANTSSITMTSGSISFATYNETLRNLNVSGGAVTSSGGSITVGGTTSISGGSFANTGGSVTFTGATTVSGGAVTHNGGTITYAGTTTVSSGSISDVASTVNHTGLVTLNGGAYTTGVSTVNFNGGLLISGGGTGPSTWAMTINSGATVTASGITLTGGGILMGGNATTLTTLTIGSGGLTLTGQTIQSNVATGSNVGHRIVLNGDLTASGANSFTINQAPVGGSVAQIYIGSASRNFNIVNNTTTVFLDVAGAGGSLVKQGLGTLSLQANNTYTGTTTVAGGLLAVSGFLGRLSGTTAVTVTGGGTLQNGQGTTATNNDGVVNRINTAAPLTLGGTLGSGTFTMAFGTSSHSQTLASLAVAQGANTVNTVNSASGTLALTFTGSAGGAGYTRSVGSSLNVVTAGFTVSLTNAPTAAGGSSVAGSGTDAILIGATLANANFVAAKAGALSSATYTDTSTTTWTAGKNMNVTGNIAATDGTAINSLRFGTLGGFTVSLAGSTTIDSGAILVTSTVGNNLSQISNGTLMGSASGDLLILQNNSSNGLTISSTIADNGGATALTKAGTGLLTLTGTNTYTGKTYLNGGSISVSNNAALGLVSTGAALNFDGGTLVTTATLSLSNGASNARNIAIAAGGGTLNQSASTTLTVGGVISGNGALTKGGAGTLQLNGANTLTGNTTVSGGTLQLGNDSALGTGTLVLNSGTVQATATRNMANGLSILLSSTVSGSNSLTFNGTTTHTATSNQTITNSLSAGSTLTLAGNVFLTAGAAPSARQLTFTGAGATVISGVVSDNDLGNVALTGLSYTGTGSLKLTGVNTNTGRTVVANGGALIVQQDRNFGAVPASAMTDAVILATDGLLKVEAGFTLNANRNIGIGAQTGTSITGTIDVASGQTFTVAGKVADRTRNADGTSSTGTNIGSLIKSGNGMLVLAGANTYSGNTSVNAGTLLVTGSISGLTAGTPTVSVASGATLQLAGSGSINTKNLTLSNNSTLSLEIGTLTSNTISLTGVTTLTGTIALGLTLTADPLDGSIFTLINGSSAVAGGGLFTFNSATLAQGSIFNVTTGSFSQDFQINYAGGGDSSDITLLAVPEPTSAVTLFASASLLVGLRRFRRRS